MYDDSYDHDAVGVVDVLSLAVEPDKQRTSARSLYFLPPSLVLLARVLHRSSARLVTRVSVARVVGEVEDDFAVWSPRGMKGGEGEEGEESSSPRG